MGRFDRLRGQREPERSPGGDRVHVYEDETSLKLNEGANALTELLDPTRPSTA